MRIQILRVLLVVIGGLWVAGCNTTNDGLSGQFNLKASGAGANSEVTDAVEGNAQELTPPPLDVASSEAGLLGGDPNDDLSVAKKLYRADNFGMAEKYFRRAAELHPRDAEAWLGLAASYDRLRRFDLADRAYNQAVGISGQTIEILNNQGFSYMLRGDYLHARDKLAAAQQKDPRNKFVLANLQLLDESSRKGKAIE